MYDLSSTAWDHTKITLITDLHCVIEPPWNLTWVIETCLASASSFMKSGLIKMFQKRELLSYFYVLVFRIVDSQFSVVEFLMMAPHDLM